jgi:pimeloyl-ACP methyl ester carboxylesterase
VSAAVNAAIIAAIVTVSISSSVAAQASACPAVFPMGTQCETGRDPHGSFHIVAVPRNWNHTLVVYDHGGPAVVFNGLNAAVRQATEETVGHIPTLLAAGYGVAVPSYRDAEFHIDDYAEDNEDSRAAFVAHFGAPTRAYMYGVSFGASVASHTIERYPGTYTAAVFTGGLLSGNYVHGLTWLDARVVYQYICRNMPRPSESQVPLWQGYPNYRITHRAQLDSAIADVVARVNECTGYKLPAAQRTPAQQRALTTILAVTHGREVDFETEMTSSTIGLYKFIHQSPIVANPFENLHAVYSGSPDDASLNRGVVRYAADPAAETAAQREHTPTGAIHIPVISSHSTGDPRLEVEYEWFYHQLVRRAGNADHLLEMYPATPNHPGQSAAELLALFESMDAWVSSGKRPAPQDVIAACKRHESSTERCTFDPAYQPRSLWTIIAPEGRADRLGVPDKR